MKTTSCACCFAILLACLCQAQDHVFSAGTNTIHLVFEDAAASPEAKELFLSDFKAACSANEHGLSVETKVSYRPSPTCVYPVGWVTNSWLNGVPTPSVMRENVGFPSFLVSTNGIWLLSVSKEYTDAYAKIREFATEHATELEKLGKFIAEDLAPDRVSSMSDDDIFEMTLDKQWAPGDKAGPHKEGLEIRPETMRVIYYPPVVAGVLEEKIGPEDGRNHLFAQLNARWNGSSNPLFDDDMVFELWAVYWRDKWWLTFWHLEGNIETKWSPSDVK